MNRDIILRRTSPVPLQTLSSHFSSNSQHEPAASNPACGAGPTLRQNPAGPALKPAGRTEQQQASGSVQTVEITDLDVHTVGSMEASAQLADYDAISDLNEVLIDLQSPQKRFLGNITNVLSVL